MESEIMTHLVYRILAIIAWCTIDSLLDHRVVLLAFRGPCRVLIGSE